MSEKKTPDTNEEAVDDWDELFEEAEEKKKNAKPAKVHTETFECFGCD